MRSFETSGHSRSVFVVKQSCCQEHFHPALTALPVLIPKPCNLFFSLPLFPQPFTSKLQVPQWSLADVNVPFGSASRLSPDPEAAAKGLQSLSFFFCVRILELGLLERAVYVNWEIQREGKSGRNGIFADLFQLFFTFS